MGYIDVYISHFRHTKRVAATPLFSAVPSPYHIWTVAKAQNMDLDRQREQSSCCGCFRVAIENDNDERNGMVDKHDNTRYTVAEQRAYQCNSSCTLLSQQSSSSVSVHSIDERKDKRVPEKLHRHTHFSIAKTTMTDDVATNNVNDPKNTHNDKDIRQSTAAIIIMTYLWKSCLKRELEYYCCRLYVTNCKLCDNPQPA